MFATATEAISVDLGTSCCPRVASQRLRALDGEGHERTWVALLARRERQACALAQAWTSGTGGGRSSPFRTTRLTPLVRGEREDGERKREVAERGFWTAHARGTRSLKGSCGERRM